MADTLESLEIQVKHSASGAADEITRVSSAISSLSTALNGVPSKLSKLAAALDMVKGKVSGITISDNSTMQVAENINNVQQAAQKASRATSEASKGVREMASAASKAKSPLDNFVSSLKRIAFYRFIRSIIKAITQAFQEGLQNAYQFSSGIEGEGHRFAAALDSMKTAGSTMKNQLGAAFIALLTALAPIINTIIGLITKLADALSQIFSAFTGKTYLKAAEVPQKWAEGAGGAAKAAKEWKNQLLGFDEINRLEEPSDGGGGGGGGGIDPSSMFTDSPIEEWALRLKEKLEPIIENIKLIFKGLGDFLKGVWLGDWDLAFRGVGEIVQGLLGLVSSVVEFIQYLVDGLLTGIQDRGNSFFDWLEEKTGLNLSYLRWQWNNGMEGLKLIVNGTFDKIQDKIQGISDFLTGVFTADWDRAFSGLLRIFDINIGAILRGLQTLWNWLTTIAQGISNVFNSIGQISAMSNKAEFGFGMFANGGYPESGQLFFAREDGAGAEMVGTVGGRTAVASNDDILNGIRQGVYEAVSAAMANNGTGEPVVRVYLDSREIKNGQNRLARSMGVG